MYVLVAVRKFLNFLIRFAHHFIVHTQRVSERIKKRVGDTRINRTTHYNNIHNLRLNKLNENKLYCYMPPKLCQDFSILAVILSFTFFLTKLASRKLKNLTHNTRAPKFVTHITTINSSKIQYQVPYSFSFLYIFPHTPQVFLLE